MPSVTRRLDKAAIRQVLDAFEAKYGMSSEAFYAQYTRGQTDDRRDFIRWAGIYIMSVRQDGALSHA